MGSLDLAIEKKEELKAAKAAIHSYERLKVHQPEIGDVGIKPYADIEKVDWIWHPECSYDSYAFLEFSLTFEPEQREFEFEITADQRYELSINEQWIAAGPDSSDPLHWSFARYRVDCDPGEITIKVFAWWLGLKSPHARMSHKPGFAFAGCGDLFKQVSTGSAAWKVRQLKSYKLQPQEDFEGRFIGDELLLDKTIEDGGWVAGVKVPFVRPRPHVGSHGIGWRLFPALMPDQKCELFSAGTIRGVIPYSYDYRKPWPQEKTENQSEAICWQRLIDEGIEVVIPAHAELSALWDFDSYLCGYPLIAVDGGYGATIRWEWAESLYCYPEGQEKGQRSQVGEKFFRGFGDSFIANGKVNDLSGHWWRSGRYVMLTIKTFDEPLLISKMAIRNTGYPWQITSEFHSSDWNYKPIVEISQRGFLHCSHETFVDCPYYEQLMYAGDSRIEALIGYTQSADDALQRRSMELFDFSRSNSGFCSARYPSRNQVDILPFSMSWVWMLSDYLFWRNDFEWLKNRLPGMRSLMAAFEAFEDTTGMLRNLPGWNFVDWVDGWREGEAPLPGGLSVIINMQYLLALLSASRVESFIGCKILAERHLQRAQLLAQGLKSQFWNAEMGYFMESDSKTVTQHAQIFALLSNLFDDAMEKRMLDALLHNNQLAQATLYFRHYYFEVLKKCQRVDLLINEMAFWQQLYDMGLFTPLERNEPSRSDCHAWSSHPLYHIYASVLGIRPLTPGFREVEIRPLTENLGNIQARMPHPDGEIHFEQIQKADRLHLRVKFPQDIIVGLHWRGNVCYSSSGLIEI